MCFANYSKSIKMISGLMLNVEIWAQKLLKERVVSKGIKIPVMHFIAVICVGVHWQV
jgi:hypothetical protein